MKSNIFINFHAREFKGETFNENRKRIPFKEGRVWLSWSVLVGSLPFLLVPSFPLPYPPHAPFFQRLPPPTPIHLSLPLHSHPGPPVLPLHSFTCQSNDSLVPLHAYPPFPQHTRNCPPIFRFPLPNFSNTVIIIMCQELNLVVKQ